MGQDAYPSTAAKAAALLESLAKNHALIDGNKRLAWAACSVFVSLNALEISETVSNDDVYDLVVAVGFLSRDARAGLRHAIGLDSYAPMKRALRAMRGRSRTPR